MESFRGSLLYMAPEILSENLYTNKVDVYSFAITAYQIVTGKYIIYNDILNIHKFTKKVLDGMRPDINLVDNEVIKKLLVKCWSNDPLKRPTFDEILNEIKSKRIKKSMNANERNVSIYLDLFNDNKKTKQEQQTKASTKQEQQTNNLFSQGKYYIVFTSNGEISSVNRSNKNSSVYH